ncbi:MAG: Uma2 family endonuclease [Acidobacteria bacterium]|nr:Uma2 family endonuclease [Acidobacteriota bacterium]MBI3658289.1 Uma2 family endonuclease [Acidobacteriota bacterium]
MKEEASVRWTIADLEPLPDGNGTRYEIIDGELYMSKQPHWHHQNTCSNLHGRLFIWDQESGVGKVVEAPGIIFGPEDAAAPDLVWVSKARLAAILGDDGKLHGAPELIIEVLSPGAVNEKRDKESKRKLYSVRGVNEYWIVDWISKTVEIYRRESAALHLAATLHADDELTSPLLPNFKLKVSHIFGE